MKAFRKIACVCLLCLGLTLVSSACNGIPSSDTSAGVLLVTVPGGSVQSNTFPPIKNKGGVPRFMHYGLEEGLSQSSARVLFQDALGFLWIGTQDGLNRFDGYTFHVFRPNPNDPDALSGREVSAIVQDKNGAIWVGTELGLNRYDPATGKFRHWTHDEHNADSLVDNVVEAIYPDPQGMLWVGTGHGLDQFDPAAEKFTHIPLPDKPAGNGGTYSIHVLHADGRGILWMGTDDGLLGFDARSQKFQHYHNESRDNRGISFNDVSSISEDKDGLLWIGTHLGLNRLDPATGAFTRFVHSDPDSASLIDDWVIATYIDRAGQLWAGTRNGLDRFDPENQQFIHYQNDPLDPASLSNNTVDSIYEDRGGLLWIGTNDGGLNKYDRSQDKFAYYHHSNADPHSLSGDIIFPIVPLPSGKLWVGTYQAGLNLFDPGTGQSEHYRHDPSNPDSLLSDTVSTLFLDEAGTLWVGTDQGMDRLDSRNSGFVHFLHDPADSKSIPFGRVYKIYQDRRSTYWIGTSQGVRIFDPVFGTFTKFDSDIGQPAGLSDGPVRAIYQDRSGTIWFGTDKYGVFRLHPETRAWSYYANDPNVRDSLSSNTILDIYEDRHGSIWIATFGGGLDRYLPEVNAFAQFQEDVGLPNDVVYGVLEDGNGHLWLSTNLGISRFDPVMGSFDNFTVKDGLQSNEFNSSAFAVDHAGRMYFGGMKGLTVFDPHDIQKNPYIPPVVVTSMTTQDGKPIDAFHTAEMLRETTLVYPQNSFDFSFAALSFSQTDKNQYKYMLEGFDKDWHTAGSDHRGSYTNLPGGTYTLRVQGSNSDGVWNEAGTSMKITVIPPFWQTWPFTGLTGTGLIVLMILLYQWRVRGIQAQKIELEQVIQERTQALKKQNLDLEALYSADDKMLRVLSLNQVLQALVDVAVDILQADKSAVFTQASAHEEYSVRVSRGFRPETIDSLRLAENEQIIMVKAAAGEPLIISDTANDPGWQRQPGEIVERMSAENVCSLMYIPIKVQEAVLGVFNICSSQPDAFDEDRQRLFASLVQRAALSIENSRLFEQTKHMAILEERNRLAQDLHDSAKQKAFAALAQLGTAKKLVNHGLGGALEHLVEAENIVSEVIHDLTFLIQELYPKDLKEKGLAASLRDYAFEWESRSTIQLNLSILGERSLPLDMEQALYRIVQEGLSNIARHSQATQANISIVYREDEVEIQIGDNGRGFDSHRTAGGLGLRLIHERAESIGGRLNIQSQSGGGTRLTIRAPVRVHE